MKTFTEAQYDMRQAYCGGATGAVASATAWLAAALVSTFIDSKTGIITLLFGGMLIFPVSVILSKILRRSGKHSKDNFLAPLALYSTVWMLLCIPIAYALSFHRPEFFFPAMLLVIGGRYLTFETLYGMKTYLYFGAFLAIAAFPIAIFQAPVNTGAFAGAIIEYLFGFILFRQSTNKNT